MAAKLHLQRCFNHAGREAVARCPECERYFCRECASEHGGRLLCAACLAKSVRPPLTQRSSFQLMLRAASLGAGTLLAWLFFYWTAAVLMKIPTEYHQVGLWKKGWLEE